MNANILVMVIMMKIKEKTKTTMKVAVIYIPHSDTCLGIFSPSKARRIKIIAVPMITENTKLPPNRSIKYRLNQLNIIPDKKGMVYKTGLANNT